MLILLCLTLLIARPQIEEFLSKDSSAPVHAVIIVDNSYYTVHKSSDGTSLDIIKAKAKEIVNSLPTGSKISLIKADENDNEFTEVKAYIEEKIDLLSPTPLNSNIRSQILSANDMLNDFESKGNNRIYVISDMNRGSWDSNYRPPQVNPESIYIVPIAPRVGNIFIEDVEVKGAGFTKSNRIFQRRETEIKVKVDGDRVLSGSKVKLIIDNKDVDEKVIFSEENSAIVNFRTSFDKVGTYFCEVIIETQDSIDIDNSFYFNINVQKPLKVYLANDVKSLSPLIYRAALSPSGWHGRQKFDVEMLSYTQIQTKLENETPDLLFLCGSMSFTPSNWGAIQSYLNKGGKVILSPESKTQFTELNKNIFPLLKNKIKPLTQKNSLKISSAGDWQRALDIPSLDKVQVSQFYTLEEAPNKEIIEIPLRFKDDSPCLTIHPVSNGQVIFWGIPAELALSNFVNNDSFPLFWHTLLEKLTESEYIQAHLTCAYPVAIFATKEDITNYKIQSPAGNLDSVPANSFSPLNNKTYTAEYDQTFIPGHYFCSSETFKGFSCNLERNKSYFQFPEKKEYQELIREDNEATQTNILSSTLSPDGLLASLLILTLLFMLLETHLGNRNYYADN